MNAHHATESLVAFLRKQVKRERTERLWQPPRVCSVANCDYTEWHYHLDTPDGLETWPWPSEICNPGERGVDQP